MRTLCNINLNAHVRTHARTYTRRYTQARTHTHLFIWYISLKKVDTLRKQREATYSWLTGPMCELFPIV